MKTMQNLVKQLTGSKLADVLVKQMLEHVEGFREDHNRYLSAVNRLKSERVSSVDNVVSAIRKRTESDLFFACFLGLKMNWDHFLNAMTPNCTWTQVDCSAYLREDVAHSLPDYRQADDFLSDFYRSLTAKQQNTYNAIMEYDAHLQTVGPKLAHYYGYLLGNTLLRRLIPGYKEDPALTVKYNAMLAEYFGKHFLPIRL